MRCGRCGAENPAGLSACFRCSLPHPAGGGGVLSAEYDRTSGYVPPFEPDAWAQNRLGTTPGSLAPQPLSQVFGDEVRLQFLSPFDANAPALIASNAMGEIGSSNPGSTTDYSRRVRLRALWRSPVFDLRPELGASSGSVTAGTPVNRGTAYGQGMRLVVQLRRTNTATGGERFYCYQYVAWASLTNADQLVQVGAPVSITAAVRNAPIAATGALAQSQHVFTPPANPVRYWQAGIVCDVIANDADAEAAAEHRVRFWAA